MVNRNDSFTWLIKQACAALSASNQELRDRYKDRPVCLMEYIANGEHEHTIEVRFDDRQATLSFHFDKDDNCNFSFLFLDSYEDEELFIDYMVEAADYIFRKGCWTIDGCFLKVGESKDGLYIHCYR